MEEILASIRRIISDDQSNLPQSRLPPRDHGRSENKAVAAPDTPASTAAPKWPYGHAAKENDRLNETVSDAQPAIPLSPHLADRRRADVPLKPVQNDPRQFFSRQPDLKQPEPKSSDFVEMGLRSRLEDEVEKPSARPILRRGAEPTRVLQDEAPLVSPTTDAAVATSFNALFASQVLPSPEMLSEIAREMLRPMLKAWLDDNLPIMVERLVRAEIERVARGGR
jgi:cell pole-organizing protein PopZ